MDLSNLKAKVNHETKNILVPRFFDMETEIDTLSIRKGLKQKMGPNDLFSLLKWVVQEHWK